MTKFKPRLALSLAIVWSVTIAASAPEEMRPVKITDGIYMFENSRGANNSTVVLTQEGVVVLDFNISNADQVLAGIRKLTDKKIRYLISSHSALDHASGGWIFREDKPIYIATKTQAHDLQMQELTSFNERRDSNDPRNAPYKGKELVQPDITFDGSMTLYFGDLTFQITTEGRGHSTGDLTVYIPQKRVFLTGDLLDTEVHPGQGESGRFFSQTSKAGSRLSIASWRVICRLRPTCRDMDRCILAAASKISKNKSATSSSCAMKSPS
ncbi:MAG TPA: MBL fold metallo-hydrolase [Candidatus Limnocylindrales bacterium]|nr:MBL fold metallo-hydrolase [Candidatus Limnocylindrales bacterium]